MSLLFSLFQDVCSTFIHLLIHLPQSGFDGILMIHITSSVMVINAVCKVLSGSANVLLKAFRLMTFWVPIPSDYTPFPGLNYPPENYWGQYEDELTNATGITSVEIFNVPVRAGFILLKIIGQSKKNFCTLTSSPKYEFDLFNKLFEYYVDFTFKQSAKLTYLANNNLPKGYKYFGINDGVANLRYFVQYNPFFASALTTVIDPSTQTASGFIIDPYADDSLYAQLTDLLDDDTKRVVAFISLDFSTVTFTGVYKGKKANIKPISKYLSDYDKAYLLLNTLVHYAQHIHTSIHIFQQLMTTCASRATHHFPELHSWTGLYNQNQGLKYLEAITILYSRDICLSKRFSKFLFSGWSNGPYREVCKIPSQLVKLWGSLESADEYVYKFLFKNIGSAEFMNTFNICTTWRKQTALVGKFAIELNTALMSLYPSHANHINSVFSDICSKTGNNGLSKQLNFKKFIELMSVSGLLHGCTLSLCRLNITPPLIALLNPHSKHFTIADVNFITLILQSIMGTVQGQSVFSYRIPLQNIPYEVIKVLQKYTGLSDTIKSAYLEEIRHLGTKGIQGNSSNVQDKSSQRKIPQSTIFRDFGWILTDHAPDGIDGKQYTLTTYI